MTDFKDFELRVRTKLDSVKDLSKVASAIEDVEKAIDRQSQAAKRGENVLDEMKGSLEALGAIQKELKGQLSLVKDFRDLEGAIAKTQTRLDSATESYNKLNAKLAEKGKLTERETVKLSGYSKQIDSLNVLLGQQREKIAFLGDSYGKVGIDIKNLAQFELQNLETQAKLGVVYKANQAALQSYSQDVRAAREAERQRAAELSRIAQQEQQRLSIINAQIANARKRDSESRAAEESAYKQRLNVLNAQIADARKRESEAKAALDQQAADQQQKRLAILNVQIANAQKRAQEAQSAAARDAGLAQIATQAETAAASYNTLARAADNLAPKQQTLREAINGILDPTKKVTSTIGGLENSVAELAQAVAKIDGPVQNYRESMDKLAAAKSALERQGSLIDTYNREVSALRQNRTELVNARAKVAEYAAEVRKGGDAGQQFVKSLNDAQAKARSAAQAMADQVLRTRDARDALRAAGVSTANLTSEQQRLVNVARQSTATLDSLKAAVAQYGVESARAGNADNPFSGKGGRTTLDLMQRIRGQVLSLTAAYVGLFGVLNLAKGGITAATTRDQIDSRLGLLPGVGRDQRKLAEENKYIAEQADRVGVNYENAAISYSKFAVAATMAKAPIEQSKFIFESFLETSRVLGMSGDDLNGLFLALSQSFSKGKIQAEELTGQIGERLPGAFAFAQQALKDKFPDLPKALEKGQVGAENLVIIAESVRRAMADQLGPATKTAAAEQERFNTAMYQFKLTMADTGYLDAYRRALIELTKFMKSEDGKKFAGVLGEAFMAVAEAVIWLAKNIEEVKTALTIAAAGWVAWKGAVVAAQIPGIVSDLRALYTLIAAGAGNVAAFGASWPLLAATVKMAFVAITAFLVGWEVGKILREKFTEVRQLGTWMVTGVAEALAWLKGAFNVVWDGFPAVVRNAMANMVNIITAGVRNGMSLFSAFATASGMDKLGKSIQDMADSLKVGYVDIGAATAKARADMANEVANIRKIRADMLADDAATLPKFAPSKAGGGRGFVNPESVKPTSTTAFNPAWMNTKPLGGDKADAEIKKRENKIEEITRALEALDAKIDRSKTESLKAQLDAIDTQYAALGRKIKELGGKEAQGFMERLTALTGALRKTTIDKFEQELTNQQQTLDEKAAQLEAASGRKKLLSLESRQAAIRKSYESLYNDLRELQLKFFQNDRDTAPLDAARARIDAGVQALLNLEEQKFKLDEINALEETRKNKIAAINEQRDAGLIDDVKAAEQINTINQGAIPAIQAAADATIQWALANSALFENQEALDQYIAKISLIKANVTSVQTEYDKTTKAFIDGSVQAINMGLNQVVDAFQKMATGQSTVADGFMGMLQGFANFAAQFLRDIAIMIIKMQIFKMLQNSGNPVLAAVGTAGMATVKHDGGIIGYGQTRTRGISPSWFAGAPRYHTGGVAGLAPDEYPAILQRGEEVLTKDSPRNILNGGGVQQGGGAGGSMRVVLVDDRARVPEAMSGSDGEKVVVQHIRKNAATIKQYLK